ncbi:ATP-binding protein [Amycolatopsis sp. NPDC005232]|uniref:AAA family ATPase n=1 Tax=Amycolatopsis sp. NPDC005232 TaxID=3157027 RepID=UPI0033A1EF75
MLRSFRLGNHRSFRDEHELLLMPALPGDRRQAVPVAAIFGANASGKSNLLDGLAMAKRLVAGPAVSRWGEAVEGAAKIQRPFRLDPRTKDEPSVFVTDLLADGVPHTYGFVVKDDMIVEEWLYSYPEKRKRVLFERTGATIKVGSSVTELRTKIGLLEELLRPDTLLLAECDRLSMGPLMAAFQWFNLQLQVVDPGALDRVGPGFLEQWVGAYLLDESARSDTFLSLLKAADIGITDLVVGVVPDRPGSDGRRMKVNLVHGSQGEAFELDDESAGTRNWLGLLPPVLGALERGAVLVVDELETSLHPALLARLISLFRDEATNKTGAQLIFTTHDTTLLGTMLGDEVLARDEIWFVDKNADGASELYPLSDFKPRKDQNTERRYLAGAYGAVPVLGDFTSALRRG